MTSQRNNLSLFEESPIVSTQFDYVEFGLIKDRNLYTVIYTFVKPDHTAKTIQASCTIETNLKSFSYAECAKQITELIMTGIFSVPVAATGTVFSPDYEEIEDIDWNRIQLAFLDDSTNSQDYIH